MRFHLRIEDERAPRDVRFLTVLQGADGGASPDAATLLRSSSGTLYEGVAVAGNAGLFPVAAGAATTVTTVEISAAGLERILVTGLEPDADCAVVRERADDTLRLSIARGRGAKADEGGVVVVRDVS